MGANVLKSILHEHGNKIKRTRIFYGRFFFAGKFFSKKTIPVALIGYKDTPLVGWAESLGALGPKLENRR